MSLFQAADILIPDVYDRELWPVVACDQFTSQPEYWDEVREKVGDAPSSYHLILPEVELPASPERVAKIHAAMEDYLSRNLFREYVNAYVYVERTQMDGSVRRGIVGAMDLEAYDYSEGSRSPIRATEGTVVERIPPRKAVRQGAPLELPHVLMLCDDPKGDLFAPFEAAKSRLPHPRGGLSTRLYDLDLMMDGGHVAGWLVQGEEAEAFDTRLKQYIERKSEGQTSPLLFAVGDGNHSLATAKACWEELKQQGADADHPARYALVELENIHDPALRFEPIHRIVTGTDPMRLLKCLGAVCATGGYPIHWRCSVGNPPRGGERKGTITLDRELGKLPVGILQRYLDDYVSRNGGEIDYIHGHDVLRQLSAKEGAIGFELPAIAKGQFFDWIEAEGVLPRKTFSMGHAQEKRYYLEARRIK
ncbi:MAG: DUF1015 domain-containing protein [Synergistaceae bacterium]|nr:DUF1015 domain-containing protein [Synergistaceae bacterium]